MKPSKLRSGQRIKLHLFGGSTVIATFIKRIPAQGKGRPARNILRSDEWRGLDGPDDDGTCTMSDYDLARKGEEL